VVPGEAVTLHWLEVPAGLAPAQAVAAARLMASEMSTQPLVDMHVAVGREAEGETARAVALVPAITMAGWIGRLQAQGLDPDLVLPEPLLLPRPARASCATTMARSRFSAGRMTPSPSSRNWRI
jgi:general secretion pathway protein L